MSYPLNSNYDLPYQPLIESSFVAKDDSIITFVLFNVDITTYNEAMSAYPRWLPNAANFRFAGEEPILIEWDGSKKDTIIGSTCTVTIVSPYDGALLPLYTTEAGKFGCAIYRQTRADGAMSDYSLIWFGWLDTEFYEEPFTQKDDYEVTLTFSDFALLKRKIFSMPYSTSNNRYTIDNYIRAALYQIDGINVHPKAAANMHPYEALCSTLVGASSALTALTVRADNFTDEDGETLTWYEVLEGILQPLGLRIEQRAGKWWVYDLNAMAKEDIHPTVEYSVYDGVEMYDGTIYPNNYWEVEPYCKWPIYYGDAEAVGTTGWGFVTYDEKPKLNCNSWQSDDQTLAVDETYNRVSPYAETTLLDGENISVKTDYSKVVYNGYGYSESEKYESFNLKRPVYADIQNPDGIQLGEYGGYKVMPFEIESLQGGSDCKGVIGLIADFNPESTTEVLMERDMANGGYNDDENIHNIGLEPTPPTSATSASALYTTGRVWIPNANGKSALTGKRQLIKIQIPMLYSEKYNPFEQADGSHNKTYETHFRTRANSIMLQVRIRIYADASGGNALYYYQNNAWGNADMVETDQNQFTKSTPVQTGWIEASTAQVLPTLIHYCEFSGSKVDSEKMACADGMSDGGAPFNNNNETDYYFRQNFDGLYIPFPNISGGQHGYWLEVEVTNGLYIYDKGRMQGGSSSDTLFYQYCEHPIKNIKGNGNDLQTYRDARWWLVGFPTIKIVENQHQIFEDIDVNDIEQSGVIDANAADELKLDTICGSCDSPLSKGAYYNANTGANVTSLTRASHTNNVEQLLIGTMYSQFAGRHLKLSGTAAAVLPTEGLKLLTDSHYSDKVFLVVQESYNVIDCESELTMIETTPDTYTAT